MEGGGREKEEKPFPDSDPEVRDEMPPPPTRLAPQFVILCVKCSTGTEGVAGKIRAG